MGGARGEWGAVAESPRVLRRAFDSLFDGFLTNTTDGDRLWWAVSVVRASLKKRE